MAEFSDFPQFPDDPQPNDPGPGDTPPTTSPDWARIADFAAGHTDYKPVNVSYLDTGTLIDLAGTYTVLSVNAHQIALSNPELVNDSWENLGDPGNATVYANPYLSTSGLRWIGPFETDLADLDRVLSSFVALNGLYEVSKKGTQRGVTKTLGIELTPVDQDGDPLGPAEEYVTNISGSDKNRDSIGVSLWAFPSFVGRCKVRARRISPTNLDKDTTVVDEIRWRDAYSLAAVDQDHFGDVTTVQVRSYATNSALSVKERKFNLLATRLLPQRIAGAEFTAELHPTNNAADIISAIALDRYIGRRSPSEIDFDSIYDTIAEVEAYFGSPLAVEFGYTFDDSDTSFEETIATIAGAVFCTAYRQGSVIRLTFERATEDSSLIFNSRNIIPGTQKRTYRFGPLDDSDGVELGYTDPKDGSALTYFIPINREAVSPRTLKVPGVRSDALAFWQAWRGQNKINYQNVAVELNATQEAELVIPKDRVLISDTTRPNTLQGDIEEQDGATLRISYPADLDPDVDYTIFLQHIDGTTEALGVIAGSDRYHVVTSAVPRMPLSVDALNFARATYVIVPDHDAQMRAFLINERTPESSTTETVNAVNYSFLYYQQDQLVLWLDFLTSPFDDRGPFRYDGIGAGGADRVADSERGLSYSGPGAGAQVTFKPFLPTASYTKAAWIKRGDLATVGSILGNANESFGFAAGPNVQAGHGGVAVEAIWPDIDQWHHVAVAFDSDGGIMALYIDGRLADRAEGVAQRGLIQLIGFDGLFGRANDVRLYRRALTARELLDIYRASKISDTARLLLESGQALTGEGGESLILE